jgi:hypothetical protein
LRNDGRYIVSSEKMATKNLARPAKANSQVLQPIRLRPSSSDYVTFARTTAIAMGKSVTNASTPKPNKRLLSLLNLGS